MCKSKQKKTYNKYNPIVLKKLKAKYGVSTTFISQSMIGTRSSETSDKIVADYKIFEEEVNEGLAKIIINK